MNTNAAAIEKPHSVYFFGTCLIDVFYPQAGVSAIALLQREGIKVIYPQQQTCCGQPAWNSGYRHEALSVARAQLALFAKPIPVVVPSASCAGMLQIHLPRLFHGEPDAARACELAERVFEFTAFLQDTLRITLTDLGEPVSVALHQSCSAQRETHSAKATQQLLQQLRNVTLREPEHQTECCGFGGTFAVKQPEISAAMAREKAAALKATDAQQLVSQDCGCLMNIGGVLDKQNSGLPHQHIAQFLWERTSG